MRKIQIICTLGPASSAEAVLQEMGESGMDVGRLNFSHGDHLWFEDLIRKIRSVSAKMKRKIPFLVDLKGGKLRLGEFTTPVLLKEGQDYSLTKTPVRGDDRQGQVNSDDFFAEVREGDRIFLNDGKVEMEVKTRGTGQVHCQVLSTGWIDSRKGVNCPAMVGGSRSLTRMEERDLRWGIEHQVDYFYLSFVRGAEEVEEVKEFIRAQGGSVPVIAKIETRSAVQRIEEIIRVSDGICVARGDLGVEIPMEDLALVQKTIVAKCRLMGRHVSVGGQMMATMVENPRPLRAEVCDVANAVIDGADALILSDETAMGKYPVQAVQIMSRVIRRTEEALQEKQIPAFRP